MKQIGKLVIILCVCVGVGRSGTTSRVWSRFLGRNNVSHLGLGLVGKFIDRTSIIAPNKDDIDFLLSSLDWHCPTIIIMISIQDTIVVVCVNFKFVVIHINYVTLTCMQGSNSTISFL